MIGAPLLELRMKMHRILRRANQGKCRIRDSSSSIFLSRDDFAESFALVLAVFFVVQLSSNGKKDGGRDQA